MKKIKLSFILIFSLILISCTGTRPDDIAKNTNTLTSGNVSMHLKKGVTTQTDVLEVFGAPNITTIDADGHEVWSYQKHATVEKSASSDSGFDIMLFANKTSASGFEQSSRTMTLIIKFNKSKIVTDFRSRATSF